MFAFSVDVEDWYQSSHDFNAPISEQCVHNTRRVLDFLAPFNVKGTFFVQGMVAQKFPSLVKEIHSRGHEIQSHGYSHRPVNRMNPDDFRQELIMTNRYIEDATGAAVYGFRAPDFSIDRNSFWAFDIMYECGISYDSSIFPMKTSRYGIQGFTTGYSNIQTGAGVIEELPVSVVELDYTGWRIPLGGGGYFRLFPYWLLRIGMERLKSRRLPFVIYCHPYEFNPDEWKQIMKFVPLSRKLHQGLGRRGFQDKLGRLLGIAAFGTMTEVLDNLRKETAATCA